MNDLVTVDPQDTGEVPVNEHLALIVGESGSGKSASLRNLRNPEKVLYMNCEAGKRLPFRNNFNSVKITDPYQVYEGFDWAQDNSEVETVVVDTLTFLMDMFESTYIVGSANTMQAWGAYQQFFKGLMQDKVARSNKQVLILAHSLATLDENTASMVRAVPVKGALKNQGVEAYFSTVVAAKKVTLKEIEKYDSGMLDITEEEKILGFKHVYQTKLTKQTVGDRIRSPLGMWETNQTFVDNDAQKLLDHLNWFYQG